MKGKDIASPPTSGDVASRRTSTHFPDVALSASDLSADETQAADVALDPSPLPSPSLVLGWCVYILRCHDGTLYTGCSSALSRRLQAHAKGSAKYTRSRLPVVLMYAEPVRDHSEALRREAAIKKLTRVQKLRLCGIT
ncbi:MAG: GIY-YIG nuclease family protein [Myxococcales bacterium]|nr:GIY-YIG nuclease family protein [Myxococcales bacterium]